MPRVLMLAPYPAERWKVLQIGQVDGQLDHVFEGRTRSLKGPGQVRVYLAHLRLRIAFTHQPAFAIHRDLS